MLSLTGDHQSAGASTARKTSLEKKEEKQDSQLRGMSRRKLKGWLPDGPPFILFQALVVGLCLCDAHRSRMTTWSKMYRFSERDRSVECEVLGQMF